MRPTTLMRKPFFVTGYEVTKENMNDVAKWCEGHIVEDNDGRSFIRVPVTRPAHDDQTKAYVGTWVLLSQTNGRRNYKVYTQEWKDKIFTELDPEISGHMIPDKVMPRVVDTNPTEVKVEPVSVTPANIRSRMLNHVHPLPTNKPNGITPPSFRSAAS